MDNKKINLKIFQSNEDYHPQETKTLITFITVQFIYTLLTFIPSFLCYSLSMKIDKYGQIILTETDICNLLLEQPDRTFKEILTTDQITFDSELSLENIPKVKIYELSSYSIQEFDQKLQDHWFMPDEYMQMDIAKFILDQCKNYISGVY